MALKQSLRLMLQEKINSMSQAQRIEESRIICHKVLSSTYYKQSQHISIYISRDDEVDTSSIIENIFHEGKTLFVPSYTKHGMEMYALHDIEDYKSLPKTKWNIPQPEDNFARRELFKVGTLDLIICPGLGFSLDGARIGRGKGYYDEYLSRLAASDKESLRKAVSIGLGFSTQLCDFIPLHDNDQKLSTIIIS